MAIDSPSGFRPVWKVFWDSNVVISSLISSTGASAAIRNLGETGHIKIFISQHVLIELDRVIQTKFSDHPHLAGQFRAFMQNAAPFLADNPPAEQEREAKAVIADPNDAPILAAAKLARVDYLVTLDVRHFHTRRVRAYLPIPILTPAEFLAAFRGFLENL